MKPEVEIALLKSRVHWWAAHSFDVDKLPRNHTPGIDNCALCSIFLERTGDCSKCPIMIKTCVGGCEGTPNKEVTDAYCEQDQTAWKHHSRRMAEFLDKVYEEQAEWLTNYPARHPDKLPCKAPCQKCGSADVHHRFWSAGESIGDDDLPSEGHWIEPAEYLQSKIRRDCIIHVCRCCEYTWGSTPL